MNDYTGVHKNGPINRRTRMEEGSLKLNAELCSLKRTQARNEKVSCLCNYEKNLSESQLI